MNSSNILKPARRVLASVLGIGTFLFTASTLHLTAEAAQNWPSFIAMLIAASLIPYVIAPLAGYWVYPKSRERFAVVVLASYVGGLALFVGFLSTLDRPNWEGLVTLAAFLGHLLAFPVALVVAFVGRKILTAKKSKTGGGYANPGAPKSMEEDRVTIEWNQSK